MHFSVSALSQAKPDKDYLVYVLSDAADKILLVRISPDDSYAFVSVEGIGAERGTVEIIDLGSMKIAATMDVAEGAAELISSALRPRSDF